MTVKTINFLFYTLSMIECQNKSESYFKNEYIKRAFNLSFCYFEYVFFLFLLSFLSQPINTHISFNARSKHHFSKPISVFVSFLVISSPLVPFAWLTHPVSCGVLLNPLEESLCLLPFYVTCGIKRRPYLHKYLTLPK